MIIKNSVSPLLGTLLTGLLMIGTLSTYAQMKIGSHPTRINKSSILELESDRQGLLLTRIGSFSEIDALIGTHDVKGMLVYYTGITEKDGAGLYLRTEVGGQEDWVKINGGTPGVMNGWGLTGNDQIVSTDFLGTTSNNSENFKIKAGGHEAMTFDNQTGNTQIHQDLTIKRLEDNDDLLDVLVISNEGEVRYRTLPGAAFGDWVTALSDGDNRMTGEVVLNAVAGEEVENFSVDGSGGSIEIQAPIMNDLNTEASYGFITKTDWDKLQGMQVPILTVGNLLAGGTEQVDGAMVADLGDGNYEIQLIAADATHNGVVTTGSQEFSGEKTFVNHTSIGTDEDAADLIIKNGNLSVSGATDLEGVTSVGTETTPSSLTVNGALAVPEVINVAAGTTTVSGVNSLANTFLIDATGGGVHITLPTGSDLIEGVIYTFKIENNLPELNDVRIAGAFEDGNNSLEFYNKGAKRILQNHGGTWYIIGQ